MTSTRDRILAAAKSEFAEHGYGGGRIERIAKSARANLRMIYHYFKHKDGLYLTVLESVYREVRQKESELHLDAREPEAAMRALVEFTFDHFLQHPEFVALSSNENMRKAEFLRRSKLVSDSAVPIMELIKKLLKDGARDGIFRTGIDPVQFFVTLHAVSYLHISNKYTLSWMLQRNLSNKAWLAERRKHVLDVIMRYVLR